MIRFFLLFCLFCSGLLAEVKILSVQQLQNGIVLNFNQIIKPTDFKNFSFAKSRKITLCL